MADPHDEINRTIETIERNAYERGWRDAIAAITDAAEQVKGRVTAAELPAFLPVQHVAKIPRRTGRPSSKAIKIVAECITATPGMRGIEVFKAAQSVDSAIKERTVRTCLRRLRLSNAIHKRDGLWYPKPKQRTDLENANGEAARSLPH